MLVIRRSEERGLVNLDWLSSRHTFSFGHYHDARHMGFGSLRVLNEDRVHPGRGFDTHGHQNMEIISYIIEGAMEHKDSRHDTASVIRPTEVQRMTAGTGIRHSEYNHSDTDPVRFLQIWILPERQGLAPGYEQKAFPQNEKNGRLCLVGSRDGRNGSITIHQDLDLYATLLNDDQAVTYQLAAGRKCWVQIVRGTVKLNGQQLYSGDGVAIEDSNALTVSLTDGSNAEVLLFDMG